MNAQSRELIQAYQAEFSYLVRLVDAAIVAATLWVSHSLYAERWHERYTLAAVVGVLLFFVAAELGGVYRSWRGVPVRQVYVRTFSAWIVVVLGVLFLGYATKTTATYSRVVIGAWLLTTPILLALWRSLVQRALAAFRARGYNSRRVGIVGSGELAREVAQTIVEAPGMGLRLTGFYDDRDPVGGRASDRSEGPVEGDFDALVEAADRGELDLVYIALPLKAEERVKALLDRLADTTVSVYLVPDFFTFNMLHGRWVNLGNLPTLSIHETPFYGVDGWVKRLEDIVLAGLILAVAALPMALIALAIMICSPGTVLFRQRRYGLRGQEIWVWKFRTMTAVEDGEDIHQATRDDPRLTCVGRFLRRTSLDELPQFINVLQGRMSVVGPRPHAVAHNEQYRRLVRAYMLRHKVKPGITGWAQVNGWRGETDTLEKMERRVEHDLWYIRNWSLWLDLKIIALTIVRATGGANAY